MKARYQVYVCDMEGNLLDKISFDIQNTTDGFNLTNPIGRAGFIEEITTILPHEDDPDNMNK